MINLGKVVVVIQARMGSTRLPGKAAELMGSKTILTHVIARARAVVGVHQVAVTTTKRQEDDTLVQRCAGVGVSCSRGQVPMDSGKNDVLAGYVQAAKDSYADTVIRITGDCPLLDPAVARRVLAAYQSNPACEYACNVEPPSWYDGCDVEVFSARLLYKAGQVAAPDEREHVTTYMRRRWDEVCGVNISLPVPDNCASIKLSVDTQGDLDRIRRVHNFLTHRGLGTAFTWLDVMLAYYYTHPTPAIRLVVDTYGDRPEVYSSLLTALHRSLKMEDMCEFDRARTQQFVRLVEQARGA